MVFEGLDPQKGYHFCPCWHCLLRVMLRYLLKISIMKENESLHLAFNSYLLFFPWVLSHPSTGSGLKTWDGTHLSKSYERTLSSLGLDGCNQSFH